MEKPNIKVKILGISGSPRKGGNTEFSLKIALEGAKEFDPEAVEIEMYSIAGKKFLPCVACFACSKIGYCTRSQEDDFNELKNKWLEADGVIIAVPVYHMGIPAQLKAFLDRLGNSLWGRYKMGAKYMKVYGAIAQGVHIFSGQEHTVTDLINHALIMGCVVTAGDLWESYIGGCGWTENKLDKNAFEKLLKTKSFDAEVAVKAYKKLGRRVAQLAIILKAGALQYLDHLKEDPVLKPFIERLEGSYNKSILETKTYDGGGIARLFLVR